MELTFVVTRQGFTAADVGVQRVYVVVFKRNLPLREKCFLKELAPLKRTLCNRPQWVTMDTETTHPNPKTLGLCRTQTIKGSLIQAWSRPRYSLACCQEFYCTKVYLPSSFYFMFTFSNALSTVYLHLEGRTQFSVHARGIGYPVDV